MTVLTDEIAHFFKSQGYLVVSTVDKKGRPHNSCKGLIDIDNKGRLYLLDLYQGRTYVNLKTNKNISVTAVDEHRFKGYCLQGKAKVVHKDKLSAEVMRSWEEKIASRITQRLLRNIREEKGHPRHPEALLPEPVYMIMMEAEEVVDLTPRHLK